MKLVFIDRLTRGMRTAADIFPDGEHTVPYIRKNTVLTEGMLAEMRRLGIRFAYIQERATAHSGGDSAPYAHSVVARKDPPLITSVMRDEAVGTLKEVFSASGRLTKLIEKLESVVSHLVDTLERDNSMIVNIGDLKSYDDYTYHHSISVAVLSIAMGQQLGLDPAALRRLGMCAMMHDIGKTAVPIELIQKPGRLSQEEYEAVKQHASAGYAHLVRERIGDEELWWGVRHHHEKVDGTGYPDGIGGGKIPMLSRILSVADVYDALTSNRPYRVPMSPADAVEYLMGGVGTSFDYVMVKAFLKRVRIYPLGSRLMLSDGRVGTVLSCENQLRPVLRLENGHILDLFHDPACRSIVICQICPD